VICNTRAGFGAAIQHIIFCSQNISIHLCCFTTQDRSPSNTNTVDKTWAAYGQSFTLWQQARTEIMCHNHSYCLFTPHIYWCYSSRTSRSWWITHWPQCQQRYCNNILLFLTNRTHRTFFLWSLHLAQPSHPGHSTICCYWKARAACGQSFTLWQQATIEIMHCNHFIIVCSKIIVCSHHIYIGVIFMYIPFVVNHTSITMPTERLQQ